LRRAGRAHSLGWLAAVLLLLGVAPARADDVQQWTSASIHHALTDAFSGHLQVRIRAEDDISQAKDFMVRAYGSWHRGSLALDLGYDYLYSFTSGTTSENRIWQAAEHRWHPSRFSVWNRVRLGERFYQGVDGVIVRFRYRLRVTHPIGSSRCYGVWGNEVFANVNDQSAGPVAGFEQNRMRFAPGVTFAGLRMEFGYEWQISA
jgi:hypothetical protein